MPKVVWDDVGEKRYHAGVDRGVLYLPDGSGVPWNGLVSVEEDLGDVTVEAFHFDGVKYLQTRTSGDYTGTLNAYTYPEEFEQFDGIEEIDNGVRLGNQPVTDVFGLSYRTKIGNDVNGLDYGHIIHLIYNLVATPTNRTYQTISDQPDALEMSWQLTATPEFVSGHRPTAHLIFDTTKLNPYFVHDLETLLYGSELIVAPPPPIDSEVLDGGTPTDSGSGSVDGGTPANPGTTIIDGGTPISSSTATVDGGSPSSLARGAAAGTVVASIGVESFSQTLSARLPSMAELLEMIANWTLIEVTDNGDGTWTATGPDDLIKMLDATTFQISSPAATFIDEDTYQITTTQGLL